MNITAITLAALCAATSVQAHWTDSLYFDLYGGFSFLGGTDIEQNGLSSDADYDIGIMTGARLGYQYTDEWGFEIEYIYRRNELDTISGGPFGTATDGDFASTSVMFNAIYTVTDLQQETFGIKWTPYLGLGLGFLTEGDIDLEIGGVETEYSDNFLPAAQFIAGINYEVNEKWALFSELRYTYAGDLDLEPTAGGNKISAKYGGASALLGLRYKF